MAKGILEFFLEAVKVQPTLINDFLVACQHAKRAPSLPTPVTPEQDLQNWFHRAGYTDVSLETCQQIMKCRDSAIATGAPDAY